MRATTCNLTRIFATSVLALGCRTQPTVAPDPSAASNAERPAEGTAADIETARVLDRRALVCAVVERNRDLAAADEAIAAARARAGRPVAAGGTRVSWSMAPGSIGSDDVPFGQIVEVEQSVRLAQRGLEREVAGREADAIALRRDAVRNDLALAAASLYDEHYELARAHEINAEHEALVGELVDAATQRYAAGLVPAQDPLQAELELQRIDEERLAIEAQQRVAAARTNRLLHRRADAPLPPPPDRLGTADTVGDPTQLREEALASRPEILAADVDADARTRAATLARRRFVPELSAMASYNSMWPEIEHRFMVGVGVLLPLQLGALRAGVTEARAEQRRTQRLREAERDRVAAEVEEALARLDQAEATLQLYEARLLPTARERVAAARIGYESNANDIDALIDAERELRSVELAHHRTLAEVDRRGAELRWAIGRDPCGAKELGR